MEGKNLVGIIDDGTREIPIKNKFGKLICNIYIRPADLSIIDRYNKLTDDLEDMIRPLQDLDINADGTAAFEKDWELMKGVETELKRRINEVFDMEEADEIFAKRNPFSSVGGKFFLEIVIEGLGQIINEAMEEELELSQKRTDKYLHDLKAQGKVIGNAGSVTAGA